MSKREQLRAGAVRDRHRDGDEEPADDRRRNVEAREQRDRTPQPVAGEENNPSNGDGVDEIEGKHRDQSGWPRKRTHPEGLEIITPLRALGVRRAPDGRSPRVGLQEERPRGELPRGEPRRAGERQLGRREIDRKPPFIGAPSGTLDRGLPVSPPGQCPPGDGLDHQNA